MLNTEHYKTQLQDARAKIEAELSLIASYDSQSDNWEAIPTGTEVAEPDVNDEADVVEEWNERRATVAVLETRYRNIVRALGKFETGTYGICEVSGEPIEEERLNANPAARTCIAHREEEAQLPL